MKTYFNKLIWIVLIILYSFSTTSLNDSEKIATFCKIWGFLKYYHPSVARGEIDWDNEFITKLDSIKKIHSKQELNIFYIRWIDNLGKVEKCELCNNTVPDSLLFNYPTNWIHNSSLFNNQLIRKLDYIQYNRNQAENYYVSQDQENGNTIYKNEKQYKDSLFPSQNLRLLCLARYWNIINYFYPYKYLTDENWNDVLTDMIPRLLDVRDTLSYQLTVMRLCTKINDSHSYIIFKKDARSQFFGGKYVPFSYKVFPDKVIVTDLYNDSLSSDNDIRIGDVFLSIDDKIINDWIKYYEKYYEASNEASSLRNFNPILFRGQTDNIKVECERNGKIFDKKIKRYPLNKINFNSPFDTTICKTINGNIGYINMNLLYPKDVAKVMDSLKNKKAIIFDLRNHSNGGSIYEISKYLNDGEKEFVKFAIPDMKYPGVYKFTKPQICGENNKDYYQGKVILLCNEWTQSHAEFTLMALQTAPNVTIVGSQTAGADGDVSLIYLPGGIKTYMSGIGVYYPDGRGTQRIGIIPDIEVKQTVKV